MSPPDGRGDPRSAAVLANETERGSDSTANLPRRLERYGKAKGRALSMRDFIAQNIPQDYATRHIAHELRECGSYLVFRQYLELDRVRLHGMRSCRQHLLCPLCAIRRGAKLLKCYLEKFNAVLQENPRLRAHMVTLTVRDGPELFERFEHLHKSLKLFHHRRHVGRGSEAEKILGAVWSYEFKRGNGSGLWHPHVHCVWLTDVDAPPAAANLSAEWREITRDSFIVETHPLYGELSSAFAEVFKYAVKFGDLPLADNWLGYQVLKRRRLVASSGVLWGVEVPDELTDDEIANAGPWIELFFRFYRGDGYVHTHVYKPPLCQAA